MMIRTAVLAVILTVAPVQKDLSGAWDVKLTTGGAAMPALVCNLTQKKNALTGTCKAAGDDQGKSVDIAGKVQGTKISCSWKVPTPDGTQWSFALTGASNAARTEIKGDFSFANESGGGGKGTFLATRK
jgi:hypothetical protein